MLELVLRHAALLGLTALVSLLLRQRSAALRHALWVVALTLLLLLPLLQRVPVALPQALSAALPVVESEQEESRAHIQGTPVALTAARAASPTIGPHRLPWEPAVVAAYATVTLALIARWGIGCAQAARLARRATLLGTARGIPVLAAEGVGPLTFGWPRGVILVPDESFARQRLVLRHEVAHVQRADFLWQGLAALACALCWWSPLVWLAARQLRREAERACDDDVLNQGISAPDYADCLLEVAAMKPRSLPFTASLVQGELSARVTALLAVGRDRRPAAPWAVLGLTALLLPVGLTLNRPVAAEPPTRAVLTASAPLTPEPAARPIKRLWKTSANPSAAPHQTSSPTPTPPALKAPIAPAALAEPMPLPALRVPNAPATAAPAALPTLSAPALPEPAPILAGSLAGKRIVLDPGHGGQDQGAVYDPAAVKEGKEKDGVPLLKDLPIIGRLFVTEKATEKDLCLAIALNAAQRLRNEGAIVTLTRDSDTFVPLSKRAEFSTGQDLYLSVHIDYSDPEKIIKTPFKKRFRVALWYHGAVGTTPPSQAQAFIKGLFTALPKPEVTTRAIETPQKPGQTSLEMTFVQEVSDDAIVFNILPDGRVYPKGFAVLRDAKCPAYLIDFGNMNWQQDVARLKDSAFQNMLAQGIVEGAKAIL